MKAILLSTLLLLSAAVPALAQEAEAGGIISGFAAKVLAAALAFAVAAASAGFGIARAGSAGLAASAERPEIRTVAIIISAFAEALAIYGIVISFFILGAS